MSSSTDGYVISEILLVGEATLIAKLRLAAAPVLSMTYTSKVHLELPWAAPDSNPFVFKVKPLGKQQVLLKV